MRAFIWRILYALACFIIFWWVFPLFLQVVKLSLTAAELELVRVCVAALAILYVLFGPRNAGPPF